MWKASEQQLNTLASLHTELVERVRLGGQRLRAATPELQEFIAGGSLRRMRAGLKQRIQTMKTVQSPDIKNGMVLSRKTKYPAVNKVRKTP